MNNIRLQLHHARVLLAASLILGALALPSENVSAAEKKSASTQTNNATGRLVIRRSANLGPAVIGLKIDGTEVTRISFNRTYNEPIAAGPHTLTVYPVTSFEGAKPTDTRLTVEPGKTYTFTLMRQDIQVILK